MKDDDSNNQFSNYRCKTCKESGYEKKDAQRCNSCEKMNIYGCIQCKGGYTCLNYITCTQCNGTGDKNYNININKKS